MKQSVFGTNKALFIQKMNREKGMCVAVLCIAIAVNIVLTLLRNEQNHTLLLWLNVALDVAVGWFLIAYISLRIVPRQRLLGLCKGKESAFEGTVCKITAQTQRVRHVDCFTVSFTVAEAERQFFLPANTALTLVEGQHVKLTAVSNVIMEIIS